MLFYVGFQCVRVFNQSVFFNVCNIFGAPALAAVAALGFRPAIRLMPYHTYMAQHVRSNMRL